LGNRELDLLEVCKRIGDKSLLVIDGAKLTGLSRSQMHRWPARYRAQGIAGLMAQKYGMANRLLVTGRAEYKPPLPHPRNDR